MANIDIKPRDENGLRHGEWFIYYDNGQLFHNGNYVHGVAHGLCEAYNKDGSLMYRGYCNMSRRIGYWYYRKKLFYLWLI